MKRLFVNVMLELRLFFIETKPCNNVLFTCVIFSLLAFGLRGASVSRTGCSSGATRSSL